MPRGDDDRHIGFLPRGCASKFTDEGCGCALMFLAALAVLAVILYGCSRDEGDDGGEYGRRPQAPHSEVTRSALWLLTGPPSYGRSMASSTSYTVTLRDHSTELIAGADAYATERVLTTFYRTGNARGAVDCWSVAIASFRTDEILSIRRIEEEAAATAGLSVVA